MNVENLKANPKFTIFNVGCLSRLPLQAIQNQLSLDTFVCVRGLFKPDEIYAARERVCTRFNAQDDRKHDPKDAEALQGNFQKLVVGGTSGINSVPRLLRMFYNPMFAEDIFGMREIFQRLTQFRNLLYGLPKNFTCNGIENGMWTASRINHYPRGGGFMATHEDIGTINVSTQIGMKLYVQLLLMLTKKGVDFHEGGAYILINNEKYFFEEKCNLGDIVIYDGRVRHGVEDIDPSEMLDLSSFAGRHVAMCTLFKHFSKQNNDEEYNALMTQEVKVL
ncbi:MAG: hypothetical protein V4525_09290 [Pseudomonadota bacterium]